jgi:hypothetical protein
MAIKLMVRPAYLDPFDLMVNPLGSKVKRIGLDQIKGWARRVRV